MEQEVIVLLHGWEGNQKSWHKHKLRLEQEGRIAISISLPGWDLPSPDSVWGIPEFSKYVVSYLTTNFPNKKYIFIGHSFGGRISIYITSHYPEISSKLVLSSAAGINLNKSMKQKVTISLSKFKQILLKFRFTQKIVFIINPIFVYLFGSGHYKKSNSLKREILKKVVNYDMRHLLKEINCPTLIIWGEEDNVTPIEIGKTYYSDIKQSHFKTIPFAGHYSHLTHFNEWFLTLIGFIDKKTIRE